MREWCGSQRTEGGWESGGVSSERASGRVEERESGGEGEWKSIREVEFRSHML